MQFNTASTSQDLFGVFSISPGKGDQKQLYACPGFFHQAISHGPITLNHKCAPLWHTNHPPYTHRKGDLPNKESHTDTCFPFPMRSAGRENTQSQPVELYLVSKYLPTKHLLIRNGKTVILK